MAATGEAGGSGAGGAVLALVRDATGRPRGSGFLADDGGTVLTALSVVTGPGPFVLYGPGERHCTVGAEAVTPLPECGLALVRTTGLGLDPLPVSVRERSAVGEYVRLAAGGWRQARVLRAGPALDLAVGTEGRDALEQGGEACGGPVLDPVTGAVLAVLSGGLRAVPLRPAAAAAGPLAELLARNAATVPAYGAESNLAGVLELTALTVGSAPLCPERVDRPALRAALTAFADGPDPVCVLLGPPGTGRTTELAALARTRTTAPAPAPTLWLRGADLSAGDTSLEDAVARALRAAARLVEPAARPGAPAAEPEGAREPSADRAAALARAAGRPLLVVLDAPEEMPAVLARCLRPWTERTLAWLASAGVRLATGCRGEFHEGWVRAGLPPGPVLPVGDLTGPEAAAARAGYGVPDDAPAPADAGHPLSLRLLSELRAAGVTEGRPTRPELFAAHLALACLRIAARITAEEAESGGSGPEPLRSAARPPEEPLSAPARHPNGPAVYGCCPPDAVAADRGEAGPGHPGGRDAEGPAGHPGPARRDRRPPAPGAPGPQPAAARRPGAHALRRSAVQVAGRVHEAARCCLARGELGRTAFEELFPWRTGRAAAVLTEGLLVPAGEGYRFADEEFADWLQAGHLDLPGALRLLTGPPAATAVPRHRLGVVVEALLQQRGPALHRTLTGLVGELRTLLREPSPAARPPAGDAADRDEAYWWVTRLLLGVLPRLPDARPYRDVLHDLAAVTTSAGTPAADTASAGTAAAPIPASAAAVPPGTATALTGTAQPAPPGHALGPAPGAVFGGGFWERLALPEADRLELLRAVLPGDGPPGAADRCLDAVARRLAADPGTVQPLLCAWFDDATPLAATPGATVATAAQALLHTHRRLALDDLAEALVARAHPAADELLAALAEEEPSALCRAVDRWSHDPRPERRVAAAAYGLRAAGHARTPADRDLLRFAALALLARPADTTAHGPALALLTALERPRGPVPMTAREHGHGSLRPA
ncbi:serine protease [Streptomyces sp. NPDC089919]|uniref:serine protease n=1 Tax=Streptomyces sp. NPDC089919 TaxID=3155188 RepID=UPI00343BA5AD